ncbi:hypothetical protein NL676_034755 [Syzygium grande]|nr:hypothetical protein NL676_034755 [Syzygium grande]
MLNSAPAHLLSLSQSSSTITGPDVVPDVHPVFLSHVDSKPRCHVPHSPRKSNLLAYAPTISVRTIAIVSALPRDPFINIGFLSAGHQRLDESLLHS